jgi:1,2-diacylglycerol 3-beta-galactosyltransferase
VLVESNSATLPQERYNTDWVREMHVGVVIKSFRREVLRAVRCFLEPGKLDAMKRNVASQRNRAVFEVPEFLCSLLQESQFSADTGETARI